MAEPTFAIWSQNRENKFRENLFRRKFLLSRLYEQMTRNNRVAYKEKSLP